MTPSLSRTVLGVLSFVPLLSLGAVTIFISQHPATWNALTSAGGVSPGLYAGPGWGLQVGAIGLVIGLMLYVYFLVRVIRASELTMVEKTAWVVILSIAGPIAIPAAWWKAERFGAA